MKLSQENLLLRIIDREGRPPRRPVTIPLVVLAIVCLGFVAYLGSEPVAEAPSYRSFLADLQGGEEFAAVTASVLGDCLKVLWAQIRTAAILVLFALIPGVVGLVYRHAFWFWFLAALTVVFLINWVSFVHGGASVSQGLLAELSYSYSGYLAVQAVMVLLFLGARLETHETPAKASAEQPRRNIAACIDGTWNHPAQRDFGHLAHTNVFKLWWALEGDLAGSKTANANLRKELSGKQIGLYYHGVGNVVENSSLGQAFGGAFGLGAEAIKERAYLDVVRESRPGDRIFIFGFSRGAAIARLLAATLERRGFPRKVVTLRIFGRLRPVWVSTERLEKKEAPTIKILGCWDTVGSFGLAKNLFGIPFQQINLLKNLTVSLAVERAYHMVALDETRDAFVPTLMDPDPCDLKRIVEVWFSGNHSNVGGGYATDGLSDLTLDFLLSLTTSGYVSDPDKLGDHCWGLYVRALNGAKLDPELQVPDDALVLHPDPRGRIRHQTGPVYEHAPRTVPLDAIVHNSVFRRMQDNKARYAPASVFDLNRRILRKRKEIEVRVNSMKDRYGTSSGTGSMTDEEAARIERWRRRLKIQRWAGSSLARSIHPEDELSNS